MRLFYILIICLFYGLPTQAQTAETYYQMAKDSLKHGNGSAALTHIKKAIQIYPTYPQAHFLEGVIESKLQNNLKAIKSFTKAIEYKPDYVEAYYNRGLLYAGTEDAQRAIVDFSEVIKMNPNIPHPYLQRGKIYFAQNDIEKATQDLEMTVRIYPKQAEPTSLLALIYHRAGKVEKAMEYVDKTLVLDTRAEDAIYIRAQIRNSQKNYPEAIKDWDLLIRYNPYNWNAYKERCLAYIELTEWEKARQDADKIIEKQPEVASHYVLRGRVHMGAGKVKKACENWKQALEKGSQDAQNYLNKFCK